jgi:hypothetical protein
MASRRTKPLSAKEIWQQVLEDWFSKEVQTGYTYSYIWMANQMGHFTLGFLFTFILCWAVILIAGWELSSLCFFSWLFAVPLFELIFWTVKESIDYWKDVKKANRTGSFKPVKKDIFLDVCTALVYIVFGIIVSYTSFFSIPHALIAFGLILLLALLPARYWIIRKICFQRAALPFQYRLSNFPIKLPGDNVSAVQDFIENENSQWQHMLVFGGRRTGKTSFAAGIGTEHTFRVKTARYTTFFKFLQLMKSQDIPDEKQEGTKIWKWDNANILLVDDINPVSRDTSLVSPDELKQALLAISPENKDKLLKRKTVWVFGLENPENSENSNEESINQWEMALKQGLGISSNTGLGIIHLQYNSLPVNPMS